jgi:hypothetical protein
MKPTRVYTQAELIKKDHKRRTWLAGNFLFWGLGIWACTIAGIFYYPKECKQDSDCTFTPYTTCIVEIGRCDCDASDFTFVPQYRPAYCDKTGTKQLYNYPWIVGFFFFIAWLFFHTLFDFKFEEVPSISNLEDKVNNLKRKLDKVEEKLDRVRRE